MVAQNNLVGYIPCRKAIKGGPREKDFYKARKYWQTRK